MLKSLQIIDFYEQGSIDLDLSDGLTILTGDNGAGKTTILNLIFNILNGDFETVNKISFKKIILNLEVEDSWDYANRLVKTIEIEKNPEALEIKYFLLNKHYVIKFKEIDLPFAQYSYELTYPKSEVKKHDPDSFLYYNSIIEDIEDLINKHKELEFIHILKENIIYFPTYRRIDSDIIQLLEQNYPLNNEEELIEFKRAINQFPNDGRVVGVNDDDIDQLFKSYSDKCRKLNSEGLNRVLKSFIEEMIISTYNNGLQKTESSANSNLYDKAPEQLIELSKQLGIENINESEIKDYFAKQKEMVNFSQERSLKLTITTKSKKKNEKKLTDKVEEELIRYLFSSIGENNDLIMRLIDLYDRHMKKVNKELEPFEYLKRSFKSFFKDKIQLYFFDYSLELSLPFKNLSTGEKQLITILSYAALSLSKKTYKPLIIIDEPELSLHISWQMKLLEKLMEIPDINILLATHSPYIANSDYENYIWQLGEIDDY
ncbi:AAA family ATPase [Cytobacillus firmus]|uniref:AAA family ATPase n=1 Tax=Cytobacillus firmus TaxID=1399 RepID=UPI0021631B43|nr:AAA family ATPase [Cytobacillus firmus]MCS0674640.1 AAA family ATPase [Cytobacillus firmus]